MAAIPRNKVAPAARRFPRWGEIAPLFDLSVNWPSREAALARCADLWDVRRLARRRVPRMVFDFVDGAAGSESSLSRARDLFGRVELEPRALRDVSSIDLSIDLLGKPNALPFFFAPTGATRLSHHAGEPAVANAAAGLGIAYCLSTLGNTSVEDLARQAPAARRWFQLYLLADRGRSAEMMRRAWDSGFDVLQFAVDTPVPGRRNRDVRNGLVVPPRLSWRQLFRIGRYPGWWIDKLTTAPVSYPMIDAISERPAERMAKVFDPAITLEDLDWVRSQWPGKLVIKGVQSLHDARLVAERGIDAVHLSSHGGRQLEHAPLPLELLPAVRDALDPRIQIFVDGGIMSGVDIIACLARGATAAGLGRAYLYGLMAGGEAGVRRVGQLLRDEVRTAMALLGCCSAGSASAIPVRLRS